MIKRIKNTKEKVVRAQISQSFHDFKENELLQCRQQLLKWYNENKRDLPWRKQLEVKDKNQRAYGIWVSEIMLQQTQVVTVIDYYNRWMKKWPTLQALSTASLEEVNQLWSGLGYYSRGRRLHEAAVKLVKENNGIMPETAEKLLKDLPGVGKYTAAAIASIAFSQATGLVDGNVVRVLSRLRAIGANSTNPIIVDSFWELANKLVDPDQPGNFNQGLMELGATVCTPKSPSCCSCPLQNICYAFAKAQKNENKLDKLMQKKKSEDIVDIECAADNCQFCIPASESWDTNLGVMNYPRKPKKKAPRVEKTLVLILKYPKSEGDEFFLVRRPDTGLLAGLWEFPSFLLNENNCIESLQDKMLNDYGIDLSCSTDQNLIGEVVHIFSHIHQTYVIKSFTMQNRVYPVTSDQINRKWLTAEQLQSTALSTAMKKVFKAYEDCQNGKTTLIKKRPSKFKEINEQELKKQKRMMESFFQMKKDKC